MWCTPFPQTTFVNWDSEWTFIWSPWSDVISHHLGTYLRNGLFMWQTDFAKVNNEPLDQTRLWLFCIKHTGTLICGHRDRTLPKHFLSFMCSYPSKIRVYSVRTLRTFPAVSSQIKPEIFPRVDLFSSFNCVTEAWDKMLIDCFQQGSCDENIYSPMEEKKKSQRERSDKHRTSRNRLLLKYILWSKITFMLTRLTWGEL